MENRITVKGKRMRQHKMQRKRKGNVREKTETKKDNAGCNSRKTSLRVSLSKKNKARYGRVARK